MSTETASASASSSLSASSSTSEVDDFNAWRRELRKGDFVSARDTVNKVYAATIIERKNSQVRVHYEGWAATWDEWMEETSDRLYRHGDRLVASVIANGHSYLFVETRILGKSDCLAIGDIVGAWQERDKCYFEAIVEDLAISDADRAQVRFLALEKGREAMVWLSISSQIIPRSASGGKARNQVLPLQSRQEEWVNGLVGGNEIWVLSISDECWYQGRVSSCDATTISVAFVPQGKAQEALVVYPKESGMRYMRPKRLNITAAERCLAAATDMSEENLRAFGLDEKVVRKVVALRRSSVAPSTSSIVMTGAKEMKHRLQELEQQVEQGNQAKRMLQAHEDEKQRSAAAQALLKSLSTPLSEALQSCRTTASRLEGLAMDHDTRRRQTTQSALALATAWAAEISQVHGLRLSVGGEEQDKKKIKGQQQQTSVNKDGDMQDILSELRSIEAELPIVVAGTLQLSLTEIQSSLALLPEGADAPTLVLLAQAIRAGVVEPATALRRDAEAFAKDMPDKQKEEMESKQCDEYAETIAAGRRVEDQDKKRQELDRVELKTVIEKEAMLIGTLASCLRNNRIARARIATELVKHADANKAPNHCNHKKTMQDFIQQWSDQQTSCRQQLHKADRAMTMLQSLADKTKAEAEAKLQALDKELTTTEGEAFKTQCQGQECVLIKMSAVEESLQARLQIASQRSTVEACAEAERLIGPELARQRSECATALQTCDRILQLAHSVEVALAHVQQHLARVVEECVERLEADRHQREVEWIDLQTRLYTAVALKRFRLALRIAAHKTQRTTMSLERSIAQASDLAEQEQVLTKQLNALTVQSELDAQQILSLDSLLHEFSSDGGDKTRLFEKHGRPDPKDVAQQALAAEQLRVKQLTERRNAPSIPSTATSVPEKPKPEQEEVPRSSDIDSDEGNEC